MIQRIGRYEIQAELGRGGFGKVYRAFDPTMGRLVAVKTLTAGGDPQLLIRFRNEAASAGKLHHKNIVTIHDFGEHEGEPYIVMELLEGEDLQKVISTQRPLSLLQKMRIMAEVSEGLQHAHSHGVVHRDVKPANIMVLPNRSVKIMDFGIALVTQAATTRLTKTGMVPGTLRYMAPEQFRGATNDSLSDVFAYATTYYELVAGQHPFDAATQPAVMYRIMSVDPDPIPLGCPECPELLDQILARALQKERELRYQSLDDMQLDIRPILMELQKTEAANLVIRAKTLVESGDVEAAQAMVREALELDPSDADARQLRRLLQQDTARHLTRPKIEEFLNVGRTQLNSRNYPDAIQNFESALRLDRTNSEIPQLIEEAKTGLRISERARQLMDRGRQALDLGNLTDANKNISEAGRLDPTNPDVGPLLSTIRLQMEAQARANRLTTRLEEIRAIVGAGQLAESLAALEELWYEFPESKELQSLLSSVRAERQLQERAAAVNEALEKSRTLVAERQFDDARYKLEELLAAHPGDAQLNSALQATLQGKAAYGRERAREDSLVRIGAMEKEQRFSDAIEVIDVFIESHGTDPETTRLRRTLQERAEAQKRRDAAQRLVERAQRMLDREQPDAALPLLREALVLVPDGAGATALLLQAEKGIEESLGREQRDKARIDATQRIRRLRSENRLAEALQEVETAKKEFGADGSIETLGAQIAAERQRQDVIESIRTAWHDGEIEEALERIRQALERNPNDAEILELKRQVDADAAKQQKRERVARLVARARELITDKSYTMALDLLDRGLEYYPEDADLQVVRELAVAAKASEDRQQGLRQVLDVIEQDYRQGRPEEALERIREARVRYGDESALLDWKRRLDADLIQRRRQEEVLRATAQVRTQLSADDPDSALKSLDDILRRCPEDGTLQALRSEVLDQARRKQRLRAVREMHDFLHQAEAEAARKKRQEIYKQSERIAKAYLPDTEIAAILAQIQATINAASTAQPKPAAIAGTPRASRGLKWLWPAAAAGVLGAGALLFFRTPGKEEIRTPQVVERAKSELPKVDVQTPAPVVESRPLPEPITETKKSDPEKTKVTTPEVKPPVKKSVAEVKPEPPKETLSPKPVDAAPVQPAKPDPQAVIVQDWEKIRGSQNIAMIEEFQRRHPNNPYASAALQLMDDIRWEGVNKREGAALRDFVSKNPNSRYAKEAVRLSASIDEIERLKKQQADVEAQQARQAEANSKPDQLRTERNAIYAALTRYTTAFDQKDIEALKAAWPDIPASSIDGLKRAFADKGVRMTMSLQPLADPEIHGGTAALQCQLATMTVQKGRPSNSPPRKVNVTLTKRGASWIIQKID